MTARRGNLGETPSNGASPGPQLVPAKNGGKLWRGGRKGGKGGRPKNEARTMFARLAEDPAHTEEVLAVLRDRMHPGFVALTVATWDRAYGKPRETLDVHGTMAAVIERVPLAILLPPLEVVAAPAALVAVAAEAPDGFALPALERVESPELRGQ